MKKSDAESLSHEIIKIISENKLDINKCRAQCYDVANMMSGSYSGVQKQIQAIVPHSLYVHCYAHRLNLCLIYTLSSLSIITKFFNVVQSLHKLLMNGQTKYELFGEVQKKKKN